MRDCSWICVTWWMCGETDAGDVEHQVAGRIAMSIVSHEVAHAPNQRAGRLGILPSYTSSRSANEGLWRTDGDGEVVLHPTLLDEGDELARCWSLIWGTTARRSRRQSTCRPSQCQISSTCQRKALLWCRKARLWYGRPFVSSGTCFR